MNAQKTTPAGGGDPAGVVLGWLETWEEECSQPSIGSAWEEDGFTEGLKPVARVPYSLTKR